MFISIGMLIFISLAFNSKSDIERIILFCIASLIWWTIPTIIIGFILLVAYGTYLLVEEAIAEKAIAKKAMVEPETDE